MLRIIEEYLIPDLILNSKKARAIKRAIAPRITSHQGKSEFTLQVAFSLAPNTCPWEELIEEKELEEREEEVEDEVELLLEEEEELVELEEEDSKKLVTGKSGLLVCLPLFNPPVDLELEAGFGVLIELTVEDTELEEELATTLAIFTTKKVFGLLPT